MKRAGALISIGFLALAACQTPTPITPVAKATATSRPIVAATTPTATVAPASAPTATPMPTTTSVATLTPTATPVATATPLSTATSLPTATPTQAPTRSPTPVTREVTVNSDGVNFRDAPATTGNVLQVLTQGTHLIAIDAPTAPDAGGIAWQNVRTDGGRSGWVAAALVSVVTPTPTPAPAPGGTPVVTPIAAAGYVYVSSVNGLNLRADHSASSNIVAQLANGQRLQTNGLGFGPDDQNLKWLNIKTEDGKLGWVAADFVSTEVPSVNPAEPPTNESAIAAELLRRTNALRQQFGLPPYTLEGGLNVLALEHSQYMAQNGVTHMDGSGLSASKRIANAGYDGRPTENIYGGLADIEVVWEYWSKDPPHLQNLLNTVNTYIGIGVYKAGPGVYYYTQDFAGPFQ
jgi:SH3-like domain-containing protein